jgi:hypothetical protein
LITYLTLDDTSGAPVTFHGADAPWRALTGAPGLPGVFGFASPRDSTYAAPGRHGAVTRNRYQQAALITLEGFVRGSTPDEAIAQWDALAAALFGALDTPRLLRWQRGTSGTGEELQALVRCIGGPTPKDDGAGRVLRYQVSVRADDPRGYLQHLSTTVGGSLTAGGGATMPRTFPVTFDQGVGGTGAVNNSGTRPTPPVFRVYGLAINPQILLVGTTQRIALTGTVAAGDYLEVDVANRTVKLNGTSPAQGMVDSANTSWFDLPVGTSTIRMLASSNDAAAHVEIDYRSAFA